MNLVIRAAVCAVGIIVLGSSASAADLTEMWRAEGFDLPESVTYDPDADAFYVSNLGDNPIAKDGNGFISRLDADGNVTDLKWITGLNAPKGTAVADGTLYVSDLDELVVIDIDGGTITDRHAAAGAKFLNDVAVAPNGRVYVADTFDNAIYVLDGDDFSLWTQDLLLVGPNGLVVMDDKLIVAELGDISQGFDQLKPGNVKQIDLATKRVSDFGTAAAIGGLDGIEPDGRGGVFVTDNPGGRLLDVLPGQPATEVAPLAPGSADFEWVPGLNLLIVPQMQESQVVAYTLTQ